MAKIKALKDNGKLIYPATIGQAVVVDGKKLTAKVSEIETNISSNSTAISEEETRAKAAEQANSTAISNEASARESADTTLQSNIEGEATRAKAAEQANASEIATNKSNIEALQETIEAGGSYTFYAAGRVKGSASPKFTKFWGSKDGLKAVLNHFHIGVIKDGKLNKQGAAGRITLSDGGEEILIDGTDGDVCVYVDTTIYMLRCTTEASGEKYNTIGLGLNPFVVEGKEAKKMEPFFMFADYAVNAKLDGDTVTKAYCIYNENVAGSYNAKTTANTFFNEDMKPSGNGFPSQYVSGLQSGEYARNKNTDTESNSPYMGLWYEWYEIWMMAMYLELGTLDFASDTYFGYGSTSQYYSGSNSNTANARTTFPDKVSAVRIATSDGNSVFWGNIMSQSFRIGAEGSLIYNADGICGGGHYTFLQMLIHDRVADNIVKAGLTDYVDNTDAVFSDLGARVITDGSVNTDTGEGMTLGQYYAKVSSVSGCQGLSDGVMTMIVDLYVKLSIADGVYYRDGTTDLSGGTAVYKFSMPVYRGICWFKGMVTQMEGFYFRQTNPEGTMITEYWSADDIRNAPVIRTTTGHFDDEAETGVLKGMTKKYEDVYTNIHGWQKDMDYDLNLHSYIQNGAGQHTYECGHIWCNASWASGSRIDSNGLILQGYSSVNASAGGCFADDGAAGRTLHANHAVSYGSGICAGACAGLLLS